MQVGFIGVGDQGGPMADAIAEAGFGLHIWARRPEAAEPYRERATLHPSPANLAAAVDLLGLCVISEDDVRGLLFEQGVMAALKPGSIIAIHSTMSPEGCRDLAAKAQAHGVHLIDAPVSGGRVAAEARKLLVLTGGDDETFERALPVLRTFGDRVPHLGPVGAGQISKILNNFLLNANIAAAQFVLEFGEALDLDRARVREVLLGGTSRSFALEAIDTLIFPGKLCMTLGRKDIGLAVELAADRGIDRKSLKMLAELGMLGRERMAGGPPV